MTEYSANEGILTYKDIIAYKYYIYINIYTYIID